MSVIQSTRWRPLLRPKKTSGNSLHPAAGKHTRTLRDWERLRCPSTDNHGRPNYRRISPVVVATHHHGLEPSCLSAYQQRRQELQNSMRLRQARYLQLYRLRSLTKNESMSSCGSHSTSAECSAMGIIFDEMKSMSQASSNMSSWSGSCLSCKAFGLECFCPILDEGNLSGSQDPISTGSSQSSTYGPPASLPPSTWLDDTIFSDPVPLYGPSAPLCASMIGHIPFYQPVVASEPDYTWGLPSLPLRNTTNAGRYTSRTSPSDAGVDVKLASQTGGEDEQKDASLRMRSPTGKKIFHCSVRGCDSSFTDRKNRHRHQQFSCDRASMARPARNIKCTQCRQSFKRPDGLVKHMTTIHKTCTTCSVTFESSDAVKVHKQNDHLVPSRTSSGERP